MRYLLLGVGLTAFNFLWGMLFTDMITAFERSYFQGLALIAAYWIDLKCQHTTPTTTTPPTEESVKTVVGKRVA